MPSLCPIFSTTNVFASINLLLVMHSLFAAQMVAGVCYKISLVLSFFLIGIFGSILLVTSCHIFELSLNFTILLFWFTGFFY